MRKLRSSIQWAARLSALAAGPGGRAWLFAVIQVLPLKRRLLPNAAVPVRLRPGDGASRWFWFSDASELFALEEIFLGGEYDAVDRASPELIVDLGANVGQAAMWLRSRFPDARIISVEPDPRTFAKLQRNLGRDPLITLCQAAITAEDGEVQLERTPHSSWGTRVSSPASPDVDHVAGMSLATLLSRHGVQRVDLLKVDIEGLEHEALGGSPALAQTTLVIGEIHADLLAVTTDRALEDMRRCGGFARHELDGDIFLLARD